MTFPGRPGLPVEITVTAGNYTMKQMSPSALYLFVRLPLSRLYISLYYSRTRSGDFVRLNLVSLLLAWLFLDFRVHRIPYYCILQRNKTRAFPNERQSRRFEECNSCPSSEPISECRPGDRQIKV